MDSMSILGKHGATQDNAAQETGICVFYANSAGEDFVLSEQLHVIFLLPAYGPHTSCCLHC